MQECGKEGVPGVYASVEKAECFIKWSMTCGDENVKPIPFPKYCESFLDSDSDKYTADRAKYTETLTNAPEGALRRIDRLRLEKKIKKADRIIDR